MGKKTLTGRAACCALLLFCTAQFSTATLQAAGPVTSELSVGWTEQTWHTRESEHFVIHAPADLSHLVPRVAAIAEDVHNDLCRHLNWTPERKTHLVITDDHDFSNGWASPYPYNQSRLYVSAPDELTALASYDDWLRLLIEHEYTHVLHLDQADGLPLSLRRVFGRFPFLFPHALQPPWLIEGLAIHHETDDQAGVGRSQSSLYDMQMRAEVERGLVSLGQVSGINRDWPTGQAYLYGAYFYDFLSQHYGGDAIQQWLHSYRRNLIPFLLSLTALNTFQADFPEIWLRYQNYLEARFSPVPGRGWQSEQLTEHGLHSFPPEVHADAVYRIYSDGHGPARLARYTADSYQLLTRVQYPGPFDVNAQGHVVMAQTAPSRDNRFYSDLWFWSEDSGWQRLTYGQRYRQARWLNQNDQLLARRQVGGVSELHLLDRTGELVDVLWRGEAGEVLGSFAISPDEQYLTAMLKPRNESWQLVEYSFSQAQWRVLSTAHADEAQPSFTSDGTAVLYSADYEGIFNLYRLDRESGETTKLTEEASGAFNPVQAGDTLYFERYSPQGYQLHRVHTAAITETPVAAPSTASPERAEPAEVALSESRRYQPWSTLRPYYWFPVFSVSSERTEVGLQTSGQDALGQHQYEIQLAYDSLAEAPYGHLSYQFSNRYFLLAERSYSDVQSPPLGVVGVRARDRVALTRLNLLNWQRDQMAIHLGGYIDRESDQWLDSRFQPLPDWRRHTVGLAWQWDNARSYRYSIYPVEGRRWLATVESHDVIKDNFSGQRYQFDAREYWHLGNSRSLSVRAIAAYADQTAYPFGLGTDRGAEGAGIFGRDRYPLRGYDRDAFVTHELGVLSVEYRQPLSRIQQNWRELPVGLRDIYGQVFLDTAYVRDAFIGTGQAQRSGSFTGIGAELSTEVVLGYNLVVPFHLGFARGLDSELGRNQFWLRTAVLF